MPHDARAIANFFLDLADDQGQAISKVAIQKLIYFAHGWSLAIRKEPFVKNQFEAWKYGPVVRTVYEAFQDENSEYISGRAEYFDPITDKKHVAVYTLTQEERDFLEEIFESYAKMGAFELVGITHQPGTPWDAIWNAPSDRITPGMKIADSEIAAYFSQAIT